MLFYLDNWMSADPNATGRRRTQRRRAQPRGRGQRPQPPLRPPAAPQAQQHAARAQRKLRARADGAAHARRRRRLHAEGRHRGRARVHRLDDRQSAQRRGDFRVRAADPRRSARRSSSAHDSAPAAIRGRRAGARHPRRASVDGAVHRDQARAPVRQRHAAAALVDRLAARFTATRRRSARGDADAAHVARVPRAGRRTRAKVKTPFEFVVSARARHRTPTSSDARPLVRALQELGHAALPVPAADRLQGHRRRLGEHRRARRRG